MTGTDGAEARGSEEAGGGPHDGVKARGRGLLVPALVFLVLAAAVAVAGWAIFARQAADMRDESASSLQAVHNIQSAQISLWFQDELSDVRLLAAAPGLVEPLKRFMDEPAGSLPPAQLRAEIEFYRRGHGIAAVSVFDDRGQLILTAPFEQGAEPARVPTPREVGVAAEALRRDGVAFSGAYLEADGSVVMDLAAPLRESTPAPGEAIGAIVVHLAAADTLFPMLESWPASMRTGESVVAALVGDRIVSVNPLPVGDRRALTVSRPAADSDLPAAMAVRGRTGVVEGVDYRGAPVLAAVGRIPETPWYLVTKQDLAVIDEPIVERGWATLAWVAGLILLAGVVLLLYWRVREARTLRELVGLERDRSRAETQYAALMREAKEIVVVHRSDATIVEANDWALQTYGYSREEFIGRSTTVFIAPEHLVPAEEATRRLEEEGGHRTFESVHRRRDGVEFPVEVGQSIIEVDDEELVLEVIRDVGERKAAEVALRDSEARYRTLFENALSGFSLQEVVLDEDGEPVDFVTLAVSPAFEAQTGLRAEDVVGRPASRAIPGILETDIIQRGGRVALTGVAERAETYFPALGRYLDIQFASPQRGQFAAIILDVTVQRAAEAGLQQTTQRLEATVLASPLAIVAIGREREVVLWNPAAAAIFGWTADEVLGRPLPIIPPDVETQAESLQRRLLSGEQFAGLDLPSVRKDGERIHTSVSLALMHGAEGEPDSVLMIFEDVTERRANVVRLARLTRLYQVLSAVTEAIPEERDPDRLFEKVCGIVVAQGGFRRAWVGRKRRNGLVQVVASAGAEDAPGVDGEEAHTLADRLGYVGVALAQGRSDTVQDVVADPRTAGMAAEAAALGIRSAAAVPVFIDGRHETVLAIQSSEPGRFDAEELALLERLAADIGFAVQAGGEEAARRKAERRLEALNRSLERRVRERTDALEGANAELEAFSYSVSHDLRAPLRALDGFSLALLEDYGEELDTGAADYLRRIRAASQRMARLIDDLLMLSRVTRRDMTLGEVDLTALARTIGAELAADEPERKVTLAVAENMSVGGDAQLLDAALRNLLGNAWKFTSRVRDAQVTVGVEDREGERVYFVRDNGAGFEAAYADKLFAPFQRLHGEDEFPGTGVGLATVQRIVRRHGGRVWAEGATGRGATVWFTLGPRGEGA